MKRILFLFLMSFSLLQAQNPPQLGVDDIDDVIKAMTLEEKLSMVIGAQANIDSHQRAMIGTKSKLVPGAAGQLNGIPRLGIPPMVFSDGPAGVRIYPKREGTSKTFYCTHFPVATLMGATWNTELVKNVGKAMGGEAKHYGIDVLLCPATNIHRNPLNGRNFEYYSEDPVLSGKICAAMVNGIQSNGVGTSVKHFALNNQETNRTGNNVVVSPRAAREIYLKPFEIAVKESNPWTIMTSYNKINGTYACERADLITDILRREWGFKGMVMSDWAGGVHPTLQMLAGNDLLMPGRQSQRSELEKNIKNGTLPMEIIDRNIKHILQCVLLTPRYRGYSPDNNPDLTVNASTTRKAAVEGMVLLKNNRETLPINPKVKKVAAFGVTSYDFIAGGTGSGDVNHAYVVSLIEGLKNSGLCIDEDLKSLYENYIPEAQKKIKKTIGEYARFLPEGKIDEMDIADINISSFAETNDVALITIGRTSGEFADRLIGSNYNLTDVEQNMLETVCNEFHRKGKRVIVILNVCGVVETQSWIEKPDAVLLAWMPGQEGGNSVSDLLTGKETPSGRLPMTWPLTYDDVPSKDDFPVPDSISDEDLMESIEGFITENIKSQTRKNFDETTYNDDIYVGYRYYTTKGKKVSYPFGYGLSYTSFKYDSPIITKKDDGSIEINVEIENIGKFKGKEVVQVYVSAPGKEMDKPLLELKAFAKTKELLPGERENVNIFIPYESLASFCQKENQWKVEAGEYKIMIAENASDKNPITNIIFEDSKVIEKTYQALSKE